MNWLIYIAGWFLGWAIFNGLIRYTGKDENWVTAIKLVIWSMLWIWVCWRFIR